MFFLQETPQQILTQSVPDISPAAAAQLPSVHHIRRNIRRQRQATNNPLPVPPTRADITIPESYQLTLDGQKFLLHDAGGDDRMLLFSTQSNLQLLQECEHWFADGTFKTSPPLYEQLYTIHGLTSDRTIPCVYALLANKRQATYTSLFKQLLELNHHLSPSTIMVDFEKAAINSALEVFPDVTVKGCFYHLTQNVYRKIQQCGLQQQYQSDSDFAHHLKMLPALAFVPTDSVVSVFEELSEAMPADAQPVMDYFEDIYIGRPQLRGRRRPATFPIPLWNMYTRAEEELPRTNNSVEGWHRRIQSSIGCYNPNFWKFLKLLQSEQALQKVLCTQLLAGHAPEPPRKRYADCNQRIVRLVGQYQERTNMEYLRGIAYNIGL